MAYGVMFHHFHDDRHPRGQGALSADELDNMLARIGTDKILPAKDWAERARADALKPEDVCLTFDDALLCQYEVAAPVLEARGLTAFWFVYSSVFEGNLEPLELYRYFRTTAFDDIDAFYGDFFKAAVQSAPEAFARAAAEFDPETYLKDFAFYSRNDRFFRYLRDEALGPALYREAMDAMMARAGFDPTSAAGRLWMTNAHLQDLHAKGHVVGLHSYSHPTRLNALTASEQQDEYARNHRHLSDVLGEAPTTMSHPCNSYGPETLDLLRELGVTLGFCSNMSPVAQRSSLEFPRQDHADLIAKTAA